VNRTHGEPERVKARCAACGLPGDDDQANTLIERAQEQDTTRSEMWSFCGACARVTCALLKRLCAEEAERGSQG
jgi:hypothetical protein